MRRGMQGAILAGAVLVGAAVGYAQLGIASAQAKPRVPKTVTASRIAIAKASAAKAKANAGPGFGGRHETVSDESVVAKAIGISEAELTSALDNGQTIAAIATAHNVTAQTVIDALVADGNSELAAEVSSGQITQAQADQEKADVTQRATDQVNGSFHHGDRGPGDGRNA